MTIAQLTTQASASITAADQWAELAGVPSGARLTISIAGVTGSTVRLEARWNQTGAYEVQKSWTANPTDAETFEAPRPADVRIGIPAGSFGAGPTSVAIGYDYPIIQRR